MDRVPWGRLLQTSTENLHAEVFIAMALLISFDAATYLETRCRRVQRRSSMLPLMHSARFQHAVWMAGE